MYSAKLIPFRILRFSNAVSEAICSGLSDDRIRIMPKDINDFYRWLKKNEEEVARRVPGASDFLRDYESGDSFIQHRTKSLARAASKDYGDCRMRGVKPKKKSSGYKEPYKTHHEGSVIRGAGWQDSR